MDAAGISVAAFGIANDPTNGVACRDRTRSRELFAFLERDIGDLSGRGIYLVQRTRTVGVDLRGVKISLLARFDPSCAVRRLDPTHGLALLLTTGLTSKGRFPRWRDMKRPRLVVGRH